MITSSYRLMLRTLFQGLCALSLLAAPSAFAATYSYVSPNYVTNIDFVAPCGGGSCANFTLTQRLQGTFSTAAPLAAGMALTDIRALITGYSFNDGLTTYSSADGQTRLTSLRAATDGAGNITTLEVRAGRWQVPAAAHAIGDAWDNMLATIVPQAVVTHNSGCLAVGTVGGVADVCTTLPGGSPRQSVAASAAGVAPTITLVPAAPTVTQAVPGLSPLIQGVLALAIALAGAVAARRVRQPR